MKFSQALSEIAKAYAPGTAAYYQAQNPDFWQKAHDDFEKVMLLGDASLEELACERFVRECKRLVEEFKRSGKMIAENTVADAFHSASIDLSPAASSVRHKHCYLCPSNRDLQIIPYPGGQMNVALICKECRMARPA